MVNFNHFSTKGRECITAAFHAAQNGGHADITPPIMMVTLLTEAADMVQYLLNHLHIDREAFKRDVAWLMASEPVAQYGASQHNLSSELVAVLDHADTLTSRTDSSLVSPEHIFWAMAEVNNRVRPIMAQHGMTTERLQQAILDYRAMPEPGAATGNAPAVPSLEKYAVNLTELAAQGKLEPVIGRDAEIKRIMQILSRKTKSNVALVGQPGTGKTAIVEGLAMRVVAGDVPQSLKAMRIYDLKISSLVAGASAQGEFEERLKKVIQEAKSNPDIVLFVDEMHQLIGARSTGNMDAANILKPEMARGQIKVIGATTPDEYSKFIENDSAFERRFERMNVEEPDLESCIAILRGVKPGLEKHHRIKILDEAIVAAVNLSHRYITDRYLPDKAIDIVDEAASKMQMAIATCPAQLDKLRQDIRVKEIERQAMLQDGRSENDLSALNAEIDNLHEQENLLNAKWENERSQLESLQADKDQLEQLLVMQQQAEQQNRYNDAVAIRRNIETLETHITQATAAMDSDTNSLLRTSLNEDDIMQVITTRTGIPVTRINSDETEKLRQLESILKQSVIGQDFAVKAVAEVIRRGRMGLNDERRPIGSFLFLGTTGVGKTEMAKTLAEYLFDSRDMIVRIDMSEYQQDHSVARLFGAPPGYIGYDDGGQLTEAVRHKPYSVVLLDEIEKAHPRVLETLLQVLDDGRMTDGQGRVVNFKNTIIIMTSNFGASEITEAQLRADATPESMEQLRKDIIAKLRRRMLPEFVNRIDDIIIFNTLTRDNIDAILRLLLGKLIKRLAKQGITFSASEDAVKRLALMAYQPEYGARPVKRTLDENIIDRLTTAMLNGDVTREQPIELYSMGPLLLLRNK